MSRVNSGCTASTASGVDDDDEGLRGDGVMYEGPPHGGLKNTTSILRGREACLFEDEDDDKGRVCNDRAKDGKSASMNSMRSCTPYTMALCRARARRSGELSIAITE